MNECPFDVISCSWPFPMENNEQFFSLPLDRELPLMPVPPRPRWEVIDHDFYWSINWSEHFHLVDACRKGGYMRYFFILFLLRIKKNGVLKIQSTDEYIIQYRGHTTFDSRKSSKDISNTLVVKAGDLLEVTQGHINGEWSWNACFVPQDLQTFVTPKTLLLPYLERVRSRLHHPDGPPLKIFTSGEAPYRTIIAVYSMLLKGYVPSNIYLFGDHQWSSRTSHLFTTFLPFAQIVPTQQVIERLFALGNAKLVDFAQCYWFVMKAYANILYPPEEFCSMDDDVFILNPLSDALALFRSHNLVYTQDKERGEDYRATWSHLYSLPEKLPTGTFNAGLFLMRNAKDANEIASLSTQVQPDFGDCPLWEQGLIACAFSYDKVAALPSHKYFFPLEDGLPGGVLEYDYANNPCHFTSIHFAGMIKKPSEGIFLQLVPSMLGDPRRDSFITIQELDLAP